MRSVAYRALLLGPSQGVLPDASLTETVGCLLEAGIEAEGGSLLRLWVKRLVGEEIALSEFECCMRFLVTCHNLVIILTHINEWGFVPLSPAQQARILF